MEEGLEKLFVSLLVKGRLDHAMIGEWLISAVHDLHSVIAVWLFSFLQDESQRKWDLSVREYNNKLRKTIVSEKQDSRTRKYKEMEDRDVLFNSASILGIINSNSVSLSAISTSCGCIVFLPAAWALSIALRERH